MSTDHWVRELPAEIMVCDEAGLILEMNDASGVLFKSDGGMNLLGSNVLDCHPDTAIGKLEGMLNQQTANAYFSTEKGVKRFFFQSPWYRDGRFKGLIEISFEVPETIPHFLRG